MWPSIKRWRDWAMIDFWPLHRIGPQPLALHFRYEKAGLAVENEPIPWNAEAVVVEALVKLPAGPSRRKADFAMKLSGAAATFPPESFRREEDGHRGRLLFRLPVPARNAAAELLWGSRSLGQMTLPVLTRDEFCKRLTLRLPTLSVRLGTHTVACQAYVSAQCGGLIATAVLESPTSLVPVTDQGLRVEFHAEKDGGHPGGTVQEAPVQLSSSQLQGRQALISVVPRKPRRIGPWKAVWLLGDVPLATQRIRAISKVHFQRSLKLADTRFVSQNARGELRLTRQMPEQADVARVGPCFLVQSGEPGVAGLCTLQVRAQVPGSFQAPLLVEHEVLITDGPTPVAPGTLTVADLESVTSFELRLRNQLLGILPLAPAPSARFSSEGGYIPPADFLWSPAAEDQLQERLTRLVEER
jgi:hypothetical protein